MVQVLGDRLIDLCTRHADQMAEQWHYALISNPRTRSFKTLDKAICQRHAIFIYKNLGQMYFAEDCHEAVSSSFDTVGFAEDYFARGVPLEEVIYALILMRRRIWLHSEQQSLYVTPEDMNEVVLSINRVLLVFDYASYFVASRYREMSRTTSRL